MSSHPGIGKSFGQRSIAHARLEHGMRAPAGELVVAEVDHDVTVMRTGHRGCARHRHVGHHRQSGLPEYDLGFAAKRPAREQAAHQLASIETPQWRYLRRTRRRSSENDVGRRLEGRGGACVCRQREVRRAEKTDREGLGAFRDAIEHRPRDGCRRRFRDQHDMFRAVVGIERIDCHQRRDRTDLGLEIAPARADRMADAAAGARDQA